MAWVCPLQAQVHRGRLFSCSDCTGKVKSAKWLDRQLMSVHEVAWEYIAGTWLAEAAHSLDVEMTETEFNSAKPHDDPEDFECKLCSKILKAELRSVVLVRHTAVMAFARHAPQRPTTRPVTWGSP